MTSERQKPVIKSLKKLLFKAEVIAAAIRDNAIEEKMPIEKDLILSVHNHLKSIDKSLDYAGKIGKHDLNPRIKSRSKQCSIEN
tara:strand:- start:115 stop:366 length:252 start_codon:yes stop_codon:yes gene_type:complete